MLRTCNQWNVNDVNVLRLSDGRSGRTQQRTDNSASDRLVHLIMRVR